MAVPRRRASWRTRCLSGYSGGSDGADGDQQRAGGTQDESQSGRGHEQADDASGDEATGPGGGIGGDDGQGSPSGRERIESRLRCLGRGRRIDEGLGR